MALGTVKRHATHHSQQQAGNGWGVDGAQSNHYSVKFLQKYGIFMTKGQQRC